MTVIQSALTALITACVTLRSGNHAGCSTPADSWWRVMTTCFVTMFALQENVLLAQFVAPLRV